MFCMKCGTEMPDDSQFCRKCGQPIGVANIPIGAGSGTAVVPALEPRKPQPKSIRPSFIIGLLLVIGFIGYIVYDSGQQQHSVSASQSQTRAFTPPPPQLHSAQIGNGALTVNAQNFSYYTLMVPDGAFNVAVRGRFSATGGTGNDIESYLLGEDAFTNWQNGHPTSAFYNSGRVTVADVNATLPNGAGTYYLIFNNRFSLLTPKAVSGDITLTYYTR